MPSLQIRELPEQIYRQLRIKAAKEHRSLSQQAIVTLAGGLRISENPKKRRSKLIHLIEESPIVPDGMKFDDPVKLIREDRER